ncbi:hypothetical protein V3C99_003912, partial [Haemonchus contortus]
MSKLLTDLDRLITAEEKVEEMLANNEALQNRKKGKQARLTSEDRKYLQQQGITLTKSEKTLTNPQVLLGCDTLWPLLNCTGTLHVLPSGLFAIPSKLGYLLSGKQELCRRKGITDTKVNDSGEKTTIAQLNAQEAEELERWDRYWSLDTCGIEEFTGTKNAEKSHVNEKVEKFFKETIEKRSDGYYVRLPFKDSGETLPTNKSLAYSRLIGVVNTLQKDPELLEQYHGVFQEQLGKGIIEEVVENDKESSTLIHYLPHQPVITPLKETTKLRIVFDASSHCKGQPSLNDILHQGPLILPELYGILLRFRMKNFVVTADVEKAFLQVRLNECDRDVTRCLWIRDTNRPPMDRYEEVKRELKRLKAALPKLPSPSKLYDDIVLSCQNVMLVIERFDQLKEKTHVFYNKRKTLLVSQEDVERIAKDQLEGIEEFFGTLRQLKAETLSQERALHESTYKEVLKAINSMDLAMKRVQEEVGKMERAPAPPAPVMVDVAIEARPDDERARIAENVEFMEAVHEEEESDEEDAALGREIERLEAELAQVSRRRRELARKKVCRPREYL